MASFYFHLAALLAPAFWPVCNIRSQKFSVCLARSRHAWRPDDLLSHKQSISSIAMLDKCPALSPEARMMGCAGDLCGCRGHSTTCCAAACPGAIQALSAAGRALLCGACSCSQAVCFPGTEQTFSKACICPLFAKNLRSAGVCFAELVHAARPSGT